MATIENQFDDEPYDQPPNPNKEYFYTKDSTSSGFTHLMKKVMSSNKIPFELTANDIKEINKKNSIGWTVLMMACRNSNTVSNQETVETLIKAGADVNIKSNNGWTVLMIACTSSNITSKQETVETLIKVGVDLNNKNNDGHTALMWACSYFNIDSKQGTVEALIKAGAKLCYTGIIACNSNGIYETIIDRHQHNPTKIEPLLNHISPELKDKYEYYQQCITNIKPIVDNQTEIYYQPNNIGALLCQTNFESKRNINYCPHKLLFLFAKK